MLPLTIEVDGVVLISLLVSFGDICIIIQISFDVKQININVDIYSDEPAQTDRYLYHNINITGRTIEILLLSEASKRFYFSYG